MCHIIQFSRICGHGNETKAYCKDATVRADSSLDMCDKRGETEQQSLTTLCYEYSCPYSSLGGLWRCCECQRGPNEYMHCTERVQVGGLIMFCAHDVCHSCTKYRCVPAAASRWFLPCEPIGRHAKYFRGTKTGEKGQGKPQERGCEASKERNRLLRHTLLVTQRRCTAGAEESQVYPVQVKK